MLRAGLTRGSRPGRASAAARRGVATAAARRGVAAAAAVAAVAIVAGCGGSGPSASTGASAAGVDGTAAFTGLGTKPHPPALPAGADSRTALVVDLTNHARVRPASIALASDTSATGLRWSDWGTPTATAAGTAIVHICTPNCGAGFDRDYPASIALSDLRVCGQHRFYTAVRLTLRTSKGDRRWGAFLDRSCAIAGGSR